MATTDRAVEEIKKMLSGLAPATVNCPAEKGRTETWLPRFSESGVRPRGEQYDAPNNILYACVYSGHYSCQDCLSTGTYRNPKQR
jgi:hypothetical protein